MNYMFLFLQKYLRKLEEHVLALSQEHTPSTNRRELIHCATAPHRTESNIKLIKISHKIFFSKRIAIRSYLEKLNALVTG